MKISIVLSLVFSVIFGSSYCDAAWIYTFEGKVSNLFKDTAGIIANEGYEIGDQVYAQFHVDFERDGYYILNNGETLFPENPSMTNNPYWYFYSLALLLSGFIPLLLFRMKLKMPTSG